MLKVTIYKVPLLRTFVCLKFDPMKKLLLILILCSGVIAHGQTTISGGTVSGTWTPAGSPYLIQGGIMIPNDSTLTIQPGVTVNFQGHYKLYVQGRLLAIGNVTDSISFTASNTSIGWYGIRFDNTPINNDTSKIIFCKIQYGKPNGPSPDNNGGGIYFGNFSKAVVSNSRVDNCFAGISGSGNGGGIYCGGSMGSSPIITYNTISNNAGGYDGCGIFCDYPSSNPIISFNTIKNNTGSGVFCYHTSPTISHNNISNNNGSGITCDTGDPTISNNTISNNNNMAGQGGGLWCEDGNPFISNNTISYNTASDGGGIFFSSGKAILINNVISNNSAIRGGGITTYAETNLVISNNLIINNTATGDNAGTYGGGGICFLACSPNIINCTIVNNEAVNGGGIFCNTANPTLINCILWNNTASSSGPQTFLYDEPSDPPIYNCNVQGGPTAFGLNGNFFIGTYSNCINAAPQFVSPSAGSGMGFNGITANWSLQSISPCINTGDTNYTYPSTDIAGNPRIYGNRIDIGAYEFQGPVGITYYNLQNQISVYPNPTNYQFFIDARTSEKLILDLYDINGRYIFSKTVNNKSNIDVSELDEGVYSLTIKTVGSVINKKIVIAR